MSNSNGPSLSLSDLPNITRRRSSIPRPGGSPLAPYYRMHPTSSSRPLPGVTMARTLSTSSTPNEYQDEPGSIVTDGPRTPVINAASSVRQLDDNTIQNFHAVFSHYDSDGDDALTIAQLRQVISLFTDDAEPPSRDNSDRETTALRLACNLLNDDPLPDTITFPQFLNFFAAYESDTDEDLRSSPNEIFQQLDPDNSGFVTPYSLHKILNYFGFKISMDQANSMTDYVASALDATHFTSKQLSQTLADAKVSQGTFESISNPKQSQTTLD